MSPKVSLIVPHFNRSGLVRETVASVEAQGWENWELIIVDDGSSPSERQAIATVESERIHIIDRRDGPKGPSRCRNLGAKAATSEFLIFLDSDDLLAPDCLARRLERCSANPNTDLWVFPVLEFTDVPGDSIKPWGVMGNPSDDARRFLQGDAPWHTSSPLWRKEAFFSLGGFNEAVFYGEDSDIHFRAIVEGLRISPYPDEPATAFVRRSPIPRITNSLDDFLVHSRRIRLKEGCRALALVPARDDLHAVWEGQFFVEAEFLLFHHKGAHEAIQKVLEDWTKHFTPSLFRRLIVKSYLSLALATRERTDLVLRIARRALMMVLPIEYFK